MFHVLNDAYFNEHYSNGFVETGITLPPAMVDGIQRHYAEKAKGHNDFPKFFASNEHLAYMEGRVIGAVLNSFPGLANKLVKKFYDKAYDKAVYCEQLFIEQVLEHALAQGLGRLFRTRYMIVAYDMYLRNNHQSPAAGIHTDLPNYHHFYETENDLSLYIPLVDLNDENGGRLSVLPESRLKVPGNVLLRLLHDHFAAQADCRDAAGYITPERIGPEKLDAFIKTRSHQELMALYKGMTALAKSEYAKDFRQTEENRGKILMFSNKNFHAAEQWKNQMTDREIYVIRMYPVYDARMRLKSRLHGVPVNNLLIDMHEGKVHRYDQPVDIERIPASDRLPL